MKIQSQPLLLSITHLRISKHLNVTVLHHDCTIMGVNCCGRPIVPVLTHLSSTSPSRVSNKEDTILVTGENHN